MEDSSHAQACIAAAVLVVILSLTALIFNSLQLIVLWKDPTKSFRSSTTVYIASLCIIQMCYGLIAGTAATEGYLACAKGEEHSPHLDSELSRLCFSFFVRTEGFLIVAFVTERFGSIVFPVFYQRGRYKAKNALFCVLCILIYSLCFSIFDKIAGKFWVRSLDAHLNVIPFGAIVVLSALLDHRLRKRSVRQAENGCDISRKLQAKPNETGAICQGGCFNCCLICGVCDSLYDLRSLRSSLLRLQRTRIVSHSDACFYCIDFHLCSGKPFRLLRLYPRFERRIQNFVLWKTTGRELYS